MTGGEEKDLIFELSILFTNEEAKGYASSSFGYYFKGFFSWLKSIVEEGLEEDWSLFDFVPLLDRLKDVSLIKLEVSNNYYSIIELQDILRVFFILF